MTDDLDSEEYMYYPQVLKFQIDQEAYTYYHPFGTTSQKGEDSLEL